MNLKGGLQYLEPPLLSTPVYNRIISLSESMALQVATSDVKHTKVHAKLDLCVIHSIKINH